jgi:hypothetical protein
LPAPSAFPRRALKAGRPRRTRLSRCKG